jgi:hypothetical protein
VLVHCGAQVGETGCDCERTFLKCERRGREGRERGREEGEGSFRFGTELRWALILVSLSPVNWIELNWIQWWSQDLRKKRSQDPRKHICISQHSWKHGWGTNALHSCLDKMWWWWWWWHRICTEHSLLTECALFFKWISSWCQEVSKGEADLS